MAESKILQKIGGGDPQLFINYIIENIEDLDDKQFSDEDLQYILTPEFLNSGVNLDIIRGYYEVDYFSELKFWQLGDDGIYGFGIYKSIQQQVLKKQSISKLLLNAFLTYYVLGRDEPIKAYGYNTVLTYIVENNEDDLFELIAFEKYKFENFDRQVVVEINKYLSTSPLPVTNLIKVLKGDDSISALYWHWGGTFSGLAETSDIQLPNKVIHLVDGSLFADNVDNYSKPFRLIGKAGGASEKDGTNDVRLKEGSSFSKFEVSNIPADTSAWFDGAFGSPRSSVKNTYNLFLTKFLNIVELIGQGEFVFNDSNVQYLYDDTISNYLESEIKGNNAWGTLDVLDNTDYTLTLKDYIAKRFLDTFRYAAWLTYIKELKDIPDEDIAKTNAQEIAKKAFGAGEKAAEESPFSIPTIDEDETTDEERADRQKFLKQCMLMTRLDDFANENLANINKAITDNKSKIHGKNKPYQNRFYMVQDDPQGDQAAMINKLIIPAGKSIQEFLDMKPSTHAYLIPKLRFYKVYTKDDGSITEFQFHFRNFTDTSRVEKLSNPGVFDRGGDYGVKSFDFSFQGATPATAKNDIKANLSLYFQSFSDFIQKKFTSEDGEKHAFVDLLLLPSGKSKEGSGAPSIFQFDAKYYRIRVDVGWEIESSKTKDLQDAIGVAAAANLTESLRKINKSFLLNMVDHTMDFRDDGSVQIDVEYRAYIESALKGTSLDALASRKSRESLKKVRKDYETILSKNRCTAQELNEIRLQLEQIEDLFKKQAYQSIMNRLLVNDSIYFKKAKDTSSKNFLRQGVLTTKVDFVGLNGQSLGNQLPEVSQPQNFTNSAEGFVDLKNTKDYLHINYFYLGDLLYAITDALYDKDGTYLEGFEKFKFVLGSFDYEDLMENDAAKKTINLANIPISCELFFEWFTQNVIKPERNSYPIMFFIRDLCTFLIVEILSETCFKRSFDKSLQFKTMNFLGKAKKKKDPLGSLYTYKKKHPENLVLNLSKHYGKTNSALPLAVDDEAGVSVNDLYNYVTIYVETPRLKSLKDAKTTRAEDEAKGVMHYQIGRDRGILKKLKFTKSDMQYIREARFFRHGNDGLMQLSAVYKVTMDMVGNTLYYPGMEVFIDPLSLFGADEESDPRVKNSVANRLGFGGYHLITNVRSSIGPGKFTTTVDALFSYAGDGDPTSRTTGTSAEVKKSKKNSITEAADNRPQSSKDYCEAAYNKVITEAIRINGGQDDYNPIDAQLEADFNVSNNAELDAVEAQVNDETVDPLTGQGQSDIGVPGLPTSVPTDDGGILSDDGTTRYPSDVY